MLQNVSVLAHPVPLIPRPHTSDLTMTDRAIALRLLTVHVLRHGSNARSEIATGTPSDLALTAAAPVFTQRLRVPGLLKQQLRIAVVVDKETDVPIPSESVIIKRGKEILFRLLIPRLVILAV